MRWSWALVLVWACSQRPAPSSEVPPPKTPAPESTAHTTSKSTSTTSAAEALPIPARSQAPESPPAGWCGETALQEALLHLGMWAPQRLINQAGKPAHPDLYSTDIPVALAALGVRHTFYSAQKRGFAPFTAWVGGALDEGDPVLAGVKVLPTQHPEWGLDHFVLVVGHGEKGLLVNTTWGDRRWVGDTETPGLSFKNAVYAIRLLGLSLPTNAVPARILLLEETASVVKLRVTCTGASNVVEDLSVPAAEIAQFQCVREEGAAAQLSVERSALRKR